MGAAGRRAREPAGGGDRTAVRPLSVISSRGDPGGRTLLTRVSPPPSAFLRDALQAELSATPGPLHLAAARLSPRPRDSHGPELS